MKKFWVLVLMGWCWSSYADFDLEKVKGVWEALEKTQVVDRLLAPAVEKWTDEEKVRSRHHDIFSPMPTRVKLESGEMIHANFVYLKPHKYIATQAPIIPPVSNCSRGYATSPTHENFWWMVFQEQSPLIVNLTVAKDEVKDYWPSRKDEPLKFWSGLSVHFLGSEPNEDWVEKTFEVRTREKRQLVRMIHSFAWPDQKVPESTVSFARLLRRINQLDGGTHPVTIHCRAGMGRTGTLMGARWLLDVPADEMFEKSKSVVTEIRKQRGWPSVQNFEQFHLMFEVQEAYSKLR